MLTPIDIQKKDFELRFRGYDSAEVDSFMDMLAKDYEKLYKDNIEMKDKIAMLTDAVNNYKAMETTLRDSILLAQKASEEIKKSASEQADTIVKDARVQAEEIRIQAQNEVVQLQAKTETIKTEIAAYKTQIKSLCAGICDMLE